jgi:mono/diheme cytochrome c family protein
MKMLILSTFTATMLARDLAKPHCGSCHQSKLDTAKPAALAVFDLDAEEWTAPMSRERLHAFLKRLFGKLDDPQRLRVRRFLEGEVASRKN